MLDFGPNLNQHRISICVLSDDIVSTIWQVKLL